MLPALARRYSQNLFESVLPFWMKHSIDRENGGFFTCLDREGTIYDTRKYVWLNGRQVWMLSRLYNEIERREEWLEAARGGAEFLRRYARDAQGRCYFSLTAEGKPVFFQRKPYAGVFVMLGWLEYWKATGEEWARSGAIDLFWAIRDWIARPAVLGRPVLEGAPAVRQLADVMVQASMALELERAVPDARYREILRECLEAAIEHRDPATGVLLENIPAGPGSLRDLPEGRLVSPGHSVEVCWFLLHILERLGEGSRQGQVLEILERSLEFGWDAEFGGLYYFLDAGGRPCLQLEAPMKLWWPHTEALYALIHAYTLTGERTWRDWLERTDDYTWRTFPDPTYGEWYGYCDRRGTPTHTLKGNSYKGCFHIPRALLYSIQRIEASRVNGR